jgi:acetyl esterase/lipase/ketosteroid isomerase-like protein
MSGTTTLAPRSNHGSALVAVATACALLLTVAPAGAQPAAALETPSVELPPELQRVLADYEHAWAAKDAPALAALFAEDAFVLSSDNPPVRGRAAIERHYAGAGGPLSLRAFAYRTEEDAGYILGGFARRKGEPDIGKFTLTLRRGPGGRWLVVSDMDNGNGERGPAPASTAPYEMTAVDTAHGDREFHLLWPEGAPGAKGSEAVDKPKITVYLAPADRAKGAAVVVCPGGGYRVVAADHEGKQVALWLNSLGVSAFVLQYRLGERYRHPAPLQDAQRAIRMVRSRAAEWRIDPKRVGILGFSAGGHLASTAATHFDDGRPEAIDPVERQGSRPDFAVLCYPVISLVDPVAHAGSRRYLLGDPADPALVELLSNERQVTARTPPTFLWHTADDAGVPVENSILFFEALHKAGVPAALHVFPHGRHGLGLAPGDPVVGQWPALCARWMEGLGLLKGTGEPR